jgi:dipeptidyl-peptidase-4
MAHTQGFRLGAPRPFAVAPDGSVFFTRTPPRDKRAALYVLDPSGHVQLLADADALLQGAQEQLSAADRARRERTRTAVSGIVDAQLSEDGQRVLIALGERVFLLDRRAGSTRELDLGEGYPLDPRLSPDGAWVAFVREGDLWVSGTEGAPAKRLARREEGFELATPEFVAQEELDRHNGDVWSPDSRSIAFQRTDNRPVQTLYVADPRYPERAPVPFKFPRAGTAGVGGTGTGASGAAPGRITALQRSAASQRRSNSPRVATRNGARAGS